MDLQGWNRADTNYMAGVTPLSVDDIEALMLIEERKLVNNIRSKL